MSEQMTDRLDRTIDRLRTTGWVLKQIDLAPDEMEAMRLEILSGFGAWVKPDGFEAYRDVPLALREESAITATRDGKEKVHAVI